MEKCVKGLEIQVLRSGAGFYIGTVDTEEGYEQPNCRLSEAYFKTREAGEQALEKGFVVRMCMENQFCNGSNVCFKWEAESPVVVTVKPDALDESYLACMEGDAFCNNCDVCLNGGHRDEEV